MFMIWRNVEENMRNSVCSHLRDSDPQIIFSIPNSSNLYMVGKNDSSLERNVSKSVLN